MWLQLRRKGYSLWGTEAAFGAPVTKASCNPANSSGCQATRVPKGPSRASGDADAQVRSDTETTPDGEALRAPPCPWPALCHGRCGKSVIVVAQTHMAPATVHSRPLTFGLVGEGGRCVTEIPTQLALSSSSIHGSVNENLGPD